MNHHDIIKSTTDIQHHPSPTMDPMDQGPMSSFLVVLSALGLQRSHTHRGQGHLESAAHSGDRSGQRQGKSPGKSWKNVEESVKNRGKPRGNRGMELFGRAKLDGNGWGE